MKVKITVTDNFYKKNETYEVKNELKWRCYVVKKKELTLIDIRHAKIVNPKKKKPCKKSPLRP